MLDLTPAGWGVLALCAIMVGAAKTGIPGIAILVVPLMALILPAEKSVGTLLGILILADVFAIVYHRHNARWTHVLRLLGPAFAGIVAAYFGLRELTNKELLKPVIGGIVLVMLGINYWRTTAAGRSAHVPAQWWFAAGIGFMAGVTTMMANAAGPVMTLYLLSMRLPKKEFVGTAAWFFFVVNWIKVPFSMHLGLMTLETVKLNLLMLPCIAVGALAGIYLLKKIPQKTFVLSVRILVVVAAAKLIFW